MHEISRREFMGAALAAGMASFASAGPFAGNSPLKLSVFSKHLQFLDWGEMALAAREIGFDGVDLTLRKGGHVEPERAEADLPRAADAIRRAGLELTMVTAGIVDADSPHAESMLKAMRSAGVKYYRWGGMKYDDSRPIPPQLEELKQRVARLADLNRRYGVCAMYHTHSGPEVGASFWDLWLILKDQDADHVSVNLDIGHAVVEGGLGSWVRSVQLLAPITRGIALKDFVWARNANGQWRPRWCPIGEGMVDFKKFFSMIRASKFAGPVQVHFEYPLGGANNGSKSITIDKADVINAMKKDLVRLREVIRN